MSDTIVEGLTQIIISLKPAQRRRLVNRLVETHALSEDDEDRMLVETRRNEASIPYDEIRRELKRKGRLK